MNRFLSFIMAAAIVASVFGADSAKSWTADNGNGTFTNPLLYDEFSDPDVIRVGDDYYLAGTTMHTVPGLPTMPALQMALISMTSEER